MMPKSTNSLCGLRVLVAEDDVLISEFIADILRDLECTVVGPARDLDETLQTIRMNDIDAAMLDVRLGEANVYPAASELKLRGIPFILTTGYRNLNGLPEQLRDAPRLTKPFNMETLVNMLKSSFSPTDRTQLREP